MARDTEEDLVLARRAYRELFLEKKLQNILDQKVPRDARVRADDTAIVVLVNDRPQRNLTKRFNKSDIVWAAIEKLLRAWSSHFCRGKILRLNICFNYVEDYNSLSVGREGEKRGNLLSQGVRSMIEIHSYMLKKMPVDKKQSGATCMT